MLRLLTTTNGPADEAKAMGYTRNVLLEGEGCSVEALIRPDADLDGAFVAFDEDSEEWLTISGWLLDNIEDLDPDA